MAYLQFFKMGCHWKLISRTESSYISLQTRIPSNENSLEGSVLPGNVTFFELTYFRSRWWRYFIKSEKRPVVFAEMHT